MIIDMLRQASTEGREISPTLTGLLGKLASVRDRSSSTQPGEKHCGKRRIGRWSFGQTTGVGSVTGTSSGTGSGPARKGKDGAGPEILPEHMAKLFDREQYETYVEKEYDDILKSVSERAEAMAAQRGTAFHR